MWCIMHQVSRVLGLASSTTHRFVYRVPEEPLAIGNKVILLTETQEAPGRLVLRALWQDTEAP